MKKAKNVLLVEPAYKSTLIPHGLMKIATYHMQRGDHVRFVRGVVQQKTLFDSNKPDIIYITSVFTYFGEEVITTYHTYRKLYPNADIKIGGVFASLMPDYIKAKTGVTPHVGLLDKVEGCAPDYSLFPKVDYGLAFTSRGCVRKCKFCAVSKIEQFHIMPHWKKELVADKPKLVIQDNNFVANPFEHQEAVMAHIAAMPHRPVVDLNSGIDVFLFRDKHAKLYKTVNLKYIRFAFDGMYQDGHIQKALELAHKNKVGGTAIIYVLFNYKDTPEEFYYRIRALYDQSRKTGQNISSYPMRYSPLDATNRKYIGEHWNRTMLKNLKHTITANYKSTCITSNGQSEEVFGRIFGRSAAEFADKLNKPLVGSKAIRDVDGKKLVQRR